MHSAPLSRLYLACVNRGVLDDALTLAIDRDLKEAQELLEAIVRAVGLSPSAPSCWPLSGWPGFAIWPMDLESLVSGESPSDSPAAQLLAIATEAEEWPPLDQMPVESSVLSAQVAISYLQSLTVAPSCPEHYAFMSWVPAKKGRFRDLFTLYSYMFAGATRPETSAADEPCQWAAKLIELDRRTAKKDSKRYRALFTLVSAQYQYGTFSGDGRG